MNGPAAYRKAATAPRHTRALAFDKLSAATRERLERALSNGATEALLAAPSGLGPLAKKGAILVGVSATAVFGWVFNRGFGDASSKDAIQAGAYGVLYGLIFATMGAAVIAFVAQRRAQRGAIFPSGRYLFPLELFEIEGGTMQVTSLDTLRSVEADGAKVVLTFEDGHTAAFWPPKGEGSTTAVVDTTRAIQLAASLTYPADEARLQRIDPLFEVRRADEWQAALPDAVAERSKRPLVMALAADLVVAAALGFAIVPARNAVSDDIMFDFAKSAPVPQWVAPWMFDYLERGTRHREEAFAMIVQVAASDRALLTRYAKRKDGLGTLAADALYEAAGADPIELALFVSRGGPRSEDADDKLFAIAKRMDSVAAWGTYLEVGRRHVDEAKALRAESTYHAAITSPQVGSLCRFVKENQGSPHEDEAWARIRKTYDGAVADFDAKEHTREGSTFAHALFDALLERADPRVTVDVVIATSPAVFDADSAMKKKYGDTFLPAGRRFDAHSLDPLKRDVRMFITTWLGEVFKGGTAEGTAPSSSDDTEDPRPRFTVRIEPVVDGVSTWRKAQSGGAEVTYVTPLVGLQVDFTGTVRREGGDVTIHWSRHLEDDTAGRMLTRDFRGRARSLPDLLEDVYQPFLTVVPQRIALSFREML